jgi:hypothetical protein
VSKSAYDGLFNTFFIVISLTVAPFVSGQIANQNRPYQIWAALSFDLPLIATIILWGYAVFSDSKVYRIASWSCLIYQIVRAPFVIVADILGIQAFVETPLGNLSPIPASVETAVSLLAAFLIMKQYRKKVASKSSKRADYVAWAAPTILLGLYAYLIAVYGTFYLTTS